MLPPTEPGTATPCAPGTNQVLVLNDTGSETGHAAINCNQNVFITTSGAVGIGTAGPDYSLDVNGTMRIQGSGLYNASGFEIVQGNSADWLRINQNNSWPYGTAAYGNWAFGSGGVSIGSWSDVPAGQLTVTGQYNVNGTYIQGTAGRNEFIDSENDGLLRVGGAWGWPGIYAESGSGLILGAASGVIDLNGNVGIGITWPTSTLMVNGDVSATTDGNAFWGNSTNSANSAFVGVNTAGGAEGAIAWGHSAFYCLAGNCNGVSSDARLKKDIEPIEDGLDIVLRLKPVTYLWKKDITNRPLVNDDSKKAKNYGFIAQDVLEVAPDLVNRGPKPNDLAKFDSQAAADAPKEGYFGLDYNDFVPLAIKALQEFYAKWSADHYTLADLKVDNDRLNAAVAAQDRKINQLSDDIAELKMAAGRRH
jgi:hypothetical protein